jgi:hypothetical protein
MLKKCFIFVLSFMLLTACSSSESAETYGPIPDWSDQEGGGGTLLHYEVEFLGKVENLYIYEQFSVTHAASTPHGNTRLLVYEDNKKLVKGLVGYDVFGTQLLDSHLIFACDQKSNVDLSEGIPDGEMLICGTLLEFYTSGE